jgi:hypothetical protein
MIDAKVLAERTRGAVAWYETALSEPAISPGAVRAYRDLLGLCREKNIAVVLFTPPDSEAFRSHRPDVNQRQLDAVRELAREFSLPLVVAQDWVSDDGFWDGHHLTAGGAIQFTQRFDQELWAPLTGRAPVPEYLRNVPAFTASRDGDRLR